MYTSVREMVINLLLKVSWKEKGEEFLHGFSSQENDQDLVKYTMELAKTYHLKPLAQTFEKSAKISVEIRNKANQIFLSSNTTKSFIEAWKLYCQSIGLAPENSEELALAFSNRSAVLFRLRKFDECIEDINRALSLQHPESLDKKLDLRKKECYKLKRTVPKKTVDLTFQSILSKFEKNEEAEQAIAVIYSETIGKHVVAKRDIKPGEIIAVKDAVSLVVQNDSTYTHCSYCAKESWASIPCEKCIYSVYCSEKCKSEAWKKYHDIECPVRGYMYFIGLEEFDILALRLAILGVREFGSIEKLREEVSDIEKSTDLKGKFCGKDGKFLDTKYRSVYTLFDPVRNEKSFAELCIRSVSAALAVNLLATKTEFFGQKLKGSWDALMKNPSAVFIGGLILRHYQLSENYFSYTDYLEFSAQPRALMVIPIHSLIQHNCNPNSGKVSMNGKCVLYATFPIKKGEQVFNTRGHFHFALVPKAQRRSFLMQKFKIDCKCVACTKDWGTKDKIPSCVDNLPPPTNPQKQKKLLKAVKALQMDYLKPVDGPVVNRSRNLNEISKAIIALVEELPMPCREIFVAMDSLKLLFFLSANQSEIRKLSQ